MATFWPPTLVMPWSHREGCISAERLSATLDVDLIVAPAHTTGFSMSAHRPDVSEMVYQKGIRRRRLVLSCLVCKKRKVKCDRRLPACTKCAEAGHPTQCKYDERIVAPGDGSEMRSDSPAGSSSPILQRGSDARSDSGGHDDLTDGIRESQRIIGLERHVADLEAKLKQALDQPNTPSSTLSEAEPASPDWVSTNTTRPLIQGASFKTQFYGASHSVGMIAYFEGLRGFLKKAASEHPVLGAQKWTMQPVANGKLGHIPSHELPGVLSQSLPPEPRCRQLMLNYFKHFEGMFRILHGPVFWRRYEDYWAGRTGDPCAFLALLLAAMSCARCLYVDTPILFDGDSSSARNEVIHWLHAVETWHHNQSPKHTTIELFQIKCLLLLSKRVNVVKLKRHYTLSQMLLSNAISIGLHRSPRNLTVKTSFYDQEMRRRLWASVAELEIAESIERGVPSLVSNLYSDIEAPGNFRDEDFDETTFVEPSPQMDEIFTESSLVRYAHTIRSIRHEVNNIVNNPEIHKGLSQTDLGSLHDRIVSKFRALVSWPALPSSSSYTELALLCKAYLELQMYELLIMLHLPFSVDSSMDARSGHSRFVCNSSARNIIGIYSKLSQHGFSQMCLKRTQIVRATLCLCLAESTSFPQDPIYRNTSNSNETVVLIQRSLDVMEERILAHGDGFRGFWLLFAASCFIEAHRDPIASAAWQEKTINRVILLCSKLSLCQVNRGQQKESSDALFARYMKHIQRTSVFAKIEAPAGAAPDANAIHNSSFNDLGPIEPMFEGFGSDAWLDSAMDDFGFYNLAGM
ncbi:hypothetical protein FH972_023849 [Carpinus fangiana]|uniref:Zn(2)-C6 fungal-type domain-containing protein n=1 Tax=Carpinus fangiana TaxID=176857 RepID=A0A5N6KWR3_9ROSI|nr:hypothetical protein FH972_023849 [Carpinus fangiana]